MQYVGWMVALLSIGLLVGAEERWAVAVLVAGPVVLLLTVRGALPAARRPDPPPGPRSIDLEGQHIRDLQASLDEPLPDERSKRGQ